MSTGQLHQLSHAYQLFHGNSSYAPGMGIWGRDGQPFTGYLRWRGGQASAPFSAVAPQASSTNAILTASTLSVVGAITFNGSIVSGGVATMDVARNITIGTTGSGTAVTFSFTGTDYYGAALIEKILGPAGSASTSSGLKAFKTVTAGSIEASYAGAIVIGFGNAIGLPFTLQGKWDLIGFFVDGTADTATVAVADTTDPATATTGDPRGTITSSVVPNGTRVFTAVFTALDKDTKKNLYGVDQYSG